MFNTYDKNKNCVVIKTETPYICIDYIENKNKKCQNFYKNILDDTKTKSAYVCPYGFCAYKTDGHLYTCLNIIDKSDMSKVYPNLKRYKQTPQQFSQYTLSQITKIIDEYERIKYETKIRRLTIHDLKNAIKHFVDLVDDVKHDEEIIKIAEANDKLFSAVEGYSLIQYRLVYHDKLLNYEDDKVESGWVNFHQVVKKLSKLLMYRGKKKGVEIEFHGGIKRSFSANKDLYLMYYILIENALKFAIENTKVNIEFSINENNELEIRFSNQCYKMGEDELKKIFESGYRGYMAIQTSKGSGLGLSLAKKIADISNVELRIAYAPITEKVGEFSITSIHRRMDSKETTSE